MKKMREYLGYVTLTMIMTAGCIAFSSCSETDPEKCACDTDIVQENMTFSEVGLSVMSVEEGSFNNVIYYNNSYYFKKRVQEDTVYYFICNPEKIGAYSADSVYTITGNVRESSNVIIQQMFVDHTQYKELEILSITTTAVEPEPEPEP